MTCSDEDYHDINQPRYPCPSCKYDCDDTNCIRCDFCINWFHQACAKLSNKRFKDLIQLPLKTFKCKFCKVRKNNCSDCNKDVSHFEKILYIV